MAAMEDVLDLYAEPYDPQRPVVCFDETTTQLLADVRPPLPAQPGRPRREDYEYRRAGATWPSRNDAPWRTSPTRCGGWWTWPTPHAPVVRVVLDNLNTHRMASLYETFPPPEARRIAKRLEFHRTSKHANWLNMAEIEFSILTRACLRGRNGDDVALARTITADETQRNTQDARTKLHRLYPSNSKID